MLVALHAMEQKKNELYSSKGLDSLGLIVQNISGDFRALNRVVSSLIRSLYYLQDGLKGPRLTGNVFMKLDLCLYTFLNGFMAGLCVQCGNFNALFIPILSGSGKKAGN